MTTAEKQPVRWGIRVLPRRLLAQLILLKMQNWLPSLLSDPSLDAIYIPLPPSMHAEWTINAAEHGKHVLCEKPLSAKSDEATIMADACRQNGVQLMDGVMWVHHERPR